MHAYLILAQQGYKAVNVIMCDTIHNSTVVLHQLHHHVSGIQSNVTLQKARVSQI